VTLSRPSTRPTAKKAPGKLINAAKRLFIRAGVEDGETASTASAGQVIQKPAQQTVRYSAPDGAIYIAVCVPAFSLEAVHLCADLS
jgi:hypothetical protein